MALIEVTGGVLAAAGAGVVVVAIGAFSYSGRGVRYSPELMVGRPALLIAAGVALLAGAAAAALADGDASGAQAAASLVVAVALLFVIWVAFLGAPNWATPAWQREGAGR
ncbi:MAG: hypothetical protein JWM47_1986 [Acidimicrobiales bacterium]|nr:hypothetical protein [Acidimicrobiales bacterium]